MDASNEKLFLSGRGEAAASVPFALEEHALNRLDISLEDEGQLNTPLVHPKSIEIEVIWGGWTQQTIPVKGATVLCTDESGASLSKGITDHEGKCSFVLTRAKERFIFSVSSHGISGEVRYDGRASHQKAQLKVFLQGYGEVVLNLYDVPKQVLGIRVEVQLKGEARGSEGQGGAGTWLSLEGEDAWSEPFQVPAVVSFQINIYSRAGLWLGHTESASVLPQHSLTLSHSLVNVPMIKFNFFSSGKGEWAEIDMTILKADEHPTPLSTQYLQLPGSLLLPGSLGGDDQLLATCDGFAPAMGNRLAEVENSLITELEFLLFPSAILRLDGITSQTSGDLILSSWAAIGPFDLKSFNIKVTLEDGVIEARNFGHLTEGLQVGNIYMPIDVDDGEILALFGWPPSKSKILSDEKFIVRGLPEEILRVKISIVQNGVTLDSSFCTDFSQEGSNTFATLLTIPQEEVSVYIQFMSRAIGAEWLFFDPIQISPESVVEAQGLTLQRTHYE